MVAIISSLSPVVMTKSGGSSTTLATENIGVSLGIIGNLHHHSGNVFATLVTVPGSNPTATLSIPFLSIFELIGLGLAKLTAFEVYLAKFEDFNKVGGAVHRKISLTPGCVAAIEITGWSVNVDGILMADVMVQFLSSDGMINPVTIALGTLPAYDGTPELHTLGPVTLNGVPVPGLQAHSGTMNAGPIVKRSDGDLFPRICARVEANPNASLTHDDPATVLATLGPLGASVGASTIMYFRSYDENTGVVNQADGISIEIVLGRLHASGFDANQGQVASTGIEVMGITDDGGDNPYIVTTGVTCPLAG